MALRGIMSALVFYPADRTPATAPLYEFQNHFPGTFLGYDYNSFTVSSMSEAKDSSAPDITITFAGTAANIDLIEEAITNRYNIISAFFRFAAANIDGPTANELNILFAHYGFAKQAESDFTSISLTVGDYNDSQEPDFPWRKIPWTILGPLGVRT